LGKVNGGLSVGGIYQIKNSINGEYYIGSAVDFRSRWRSHLSYLRRGVHNNPILQHAWAKYGEAAFVFEILDIVENLEELLEREQQVLDMNFPAYNISRVAGSPMAGLIHSDTTRAKMSQSTKAYWESHPEQKEVLSKSRKGIKLSEQTCKRISEATKGSHTMTADQKILLIDISRNRERSDDERQKRRESMTGFRHSPESIAKCQEAKKEYWRKVKDGEIVRGPIPRDDKGKYTKMKDTGQ
jgi:group I intron endonuclease